MSGKRSVYKVIFNSQGKVYEIFARGVSQPEELFGFVQIDDVVFGERSQVVVDPSEESLKHEFEGVKRVFVPLHAVVRIDQVEREGTARITPISESGNVSSFPSPPSGKPPGRDEST